MYMDRRYFFSRIDKKVKVVESAAELPCPIRNIDSKDTTYIGPRVIIISYLRSPA